MDSGVDIVNDLTNLWNMLKTKKNLLITCYCALFFVIFGCKTKSKLHQRYSYALENLQKEDLCGPRFFAFTSPQELGEQLDKAKASLLDDGASEVKFKKKEAVGWLESFSQGFGPGSTNPYPQTEMARPLNWRNSVEFTDLVLAADADSKTARNINTAWNVINNRIKVLNDILYQVQSLDREGYFKTDGAAMDGRGVGALEDAKATGSNSYDLYRKMLLVDAHLISDQILRDKAIFERQIEDLKVGRSSSFELSELHVDETRTEFRKRAIDDKRWWQVAEEVYLPEELRVNKKKEVEGFRKEVLKKSQELFDIKADSSSKLSALQNTIAQQKEEINRLKELLVQANGELEQVKNSNGQVEKSKAELENSELRKKITGLENQIAVLEDSNRANAALEKKWKALDDKMNRLAQVNQGLMAQMTELEAKDVVLNEKLTEQRKIVSDMRKQLTKEKAIYEKAKSELDARYREELRSQADIADANLKSLQVESETKIAQLEQDVGNIRQQNEDLSNRYSALEQKLGVTEKVIEGKDAEISRLQDKINNIQGQLDAEKAARGVDTANADKLKKSLEGAQMNLKKAESAAATNGKVGSIAYGIGGAAVIGASLVILTAVAIYGHNKAKDIKQNKERDERLKQFYLSGASCSP